MTLLRNILCVLFNTLAINGTEEILYPQKQLLVFKPKKNQHTQQEFNLDN